MLRSVYIALVIAGANASDCDVFTKAPYLTTETSGWSAMWCQMGAVTMKTVLEKTNMPECMALKEKFDDAKSCKEYGEAQFMGCHDPECQAATNLTFASSALDKLVKESDPHASLKTAPLFGLFVIAAFAFGSLSIFKMMRARPAAPAAPLI